MKVRKEVTVAVIIGLLLGGVVVGGVLRARTALMSMTPAQTSKPAPQEKVVDSDNKKGLFLTLETADNQVVKDPKLTVSGKTLPGTYIVINGEAGDSIIVPSDTGSFSQDVTLVKGANTITITVYQQDGTKQDATLTAIYTTAEI